MMENWWLMQVQSSVCLDMRSAWLLSLLFSEKSLNLKMKKFGQMLRTWSSWLNLIADKLYSKVEQVAAWKIYMINHSQQPISTHPKDNQYAKGTKAPSMRPSFYSNLKITWGTSQEAQQKTTGPRPI